MEKAEARKLQPYFIRAFFSQAFAALAANCVPREQPALRSPNVPPSFVSATARSPAAIAATLTPCCAATSGSASEKQYVRLADRDGSADGQPAHPGHPSYAIGHRSCWSSTATSSSKARCWLTRRHRASRRK